LTEELLWLAIAISALVIAVSFAIVAWSTWQVSADARRAARATEELMTTLSKELPPTAAALQRASGSLDQLAAEGASQLATVERAAREAEATMASVRELSSTVNGIMRGPAETVTGVKKSARMVGDGLASGAERIRRVIQGNDNPE
jgi:hypothetical protein